MDPELLLKRARGVQMTNLTAAIGAWIFLVMFIIGLALYRKFVSVHEDRYVHISHGEARYVPNQIAVNQQIEKLDKWGEILTGGALFTGLALACAYLYIALR
jgi:hypothetical protein